VLLLIAFLESYIIVAGLQNQIATNSTTNNGVFLEDTTLGAIFLGVMASIGFVLISQGLSGIRREEMIELQGPARRVVNRDEAREREAASANGIVAPAQPPPREEAKPVETRNAYIPPSIPSVRADEEPSTVRSAAPIPIPPRPDSYTSGSYSRPSGTTYAQSTATQVPVASAPPRGTGPPVLWEGGAPPKLEGVEILPEPPEHDARVQETPAPPVHSQSGFQVKRRRGRPKGSKNKPENGTTGQQADESAGQSGQPESAGENAGSSSEESGSASNGGTQSPELPNSTTGESSQPTQDAASGIEQSENNTSQ
jgi:hypothetical protein